MIRELAAQVIRQVVQTYPWLAQPTAVTARITAVSGGEETLSAECYVTEAGTGERKLCTIERPIYLYTVQVTDDNGTPLSKYPAIPRIRSAGAYRVGDLVTVVFAGEELGPVIVGG